MTDERSRRKTLFDETNSVAVVLADGQTWYVPKPWLELRPGFRDGKAVGAFTVLTYSREVDDLIARLADSQTFVDQMSTVATLAAWLLQFQYDLTDADLDQLLAYRRNDPASLAWARTVIEVATGRSGPKVLSAGDD
jgi:hypothetical protein